MSYFVGYFVACLVGLDELATALLYFFKYGWSNRVPAIRGAFCSAARIIFSSSELMRVATSVSASLEEVHTTLQGDALALPLDFTLVTVVHCWLWAMSG